MLFLFSILRVAFEVNICKTKNHPQTFQKTLVKTIPLFNYICNLLKNREEV